MDKKQQEQFITAFIDNNFNISKSCQTCNISRQTFYNNLYKFDTFKQKLEQAKEQAVHYVENALMEQIESGNTQAIIFYLKTKGKKYGYGEQVELHADKNNSLKVEFISTKEQAIKDLKRMGINPALYE